MLPRHPLLSMLSASASASAVAGVAAAGSRIFLPELTGPHKISLKHLELIDESRVDPFALDPDPGSNVKPRDLMVTLFYPTADSSVAVEAEPPPSAFAPQFPGPATASYMDELLHLPNGTASRLTTRAYLDAPILMIDSSDLDPATNTNNIILFSHGFGFTRSLYTALLSDLASHGWIAASVDHPHDAGIVEYPDGRVVRARSDTDPDWSWPLAPDLRESLLETRVADLLFVLAQLGNSASTSTSDTVAAKKKLPDLFAESEEGNHHFSRGLNTSRVAALGHSFGGATAVQALLNSSDHVVAAADLDGFLYGPVVRRGTRKPVLVLGFPEHFATDDPDAAPGWPSLRGWKADFTVEGTVHESFSDYPVIRDVLGVGGGEDGDGPLGDVGKVGGPRMVDIMGAYFGAFLERFVLGFSDGDGGGGGDGNGNGNGGFLEGNSSAFPEVKLRRKGVDDEQTQLRDPKSEL